MTAAVVIVVSVVIIMLPAALAFAVVIVPVLLLVHGNQRSGHVGRSGVHDGHGRLALGRVAAPVSHREGHRVLAHVGAGERGVDEAQCDPTAVVLAAIVDVRRGEAGIAFGVRLRFVTCRKRNLQVELNGEKIVDLDLSDSPRKDRPLVGYIGLQDHGLPLWFRNIWSTELDDK